jgi:CheY-like chemotaxis protein
MNSPFSGRRVLVVEDEMIVAWLLVDMLDDLGCAIVGPATSGLIHSDDSQIDRSSSGSRHESRNCGERHQSGSPSA